jgi:hypothetical protein
MTKIRLMLAAALTAAAVPGHANVVWDYLVTDITCTGICGPVPAPSYVIAELILPGPTSSGSAFWQFGHPIFPGDPPPIHAGDDFIFSTTFGSRITPTDLTDAAHAQSLNPIKHYELSWSETDDILDSILIVFDTRIDNLRLSLTGGTLISDRDGPLGCYILSGTCQLIGSWIVAPVDEPRELPAALLLLALIGSALMRDKSRSRLRQRLL